MQNTLSVVDDAPIEAGFFVPVFEGIAAKIVSARGRMPPPNEAFDAEAVALLRDHLANGDMDTVLEAPLPVLSAVMVHLQAFCSAAMEEPHAIIGQLPKGASFSDALGVAVEWIAAGDKKVH